MGAHYVFSIYYIETYRGGVPTLFCVCASGCQAYHQETKQRTSEFVFFRAKTYNISKTATAVRLLRLLCHSMTASRLVYFCSRSMAVQGMLLCTRMIMCQCIGVMRGHVLSCTPLPWHFLVVPTDTRPPATLLGAHVHTTNTGRRRSLSREKKTISFVRGTLTHAPRNRSRRHNRRPQLPRVWQAKGVLRNLTYIFLMCLPCPLPPPTGPASGSGLS